ncbi:hypothetical protein AAVH_21979 [Aphelenchoides avenae]|nr:hypothetical protein AAVH_21979 [Aphelenchus avenae]
MLELPSSEAVKTQVTDSLANAAEKLTSLSWKERPAFYDNAIRDAVRHLKTSNYSGSVNGVLYLPYDTSNSEVHCAHAVDNGSYSGLVDDMAHYFVKYTQNAAVAATMKEKFEALEAKKDRIIKTVFAESQRDLCERVHTALDDQRPKRERREVESDVLEDAEFSAFVAVKCSYDFVWYELGWRYYTAARTTSEYVLEKNDGAFDASCGQLIFLP